MNKFANPAVQDGVATEENAASASFYAVRRRARRTEHAMGFIIGLVFDAAIIGIIIAVMERGEFPGWGPSIGCVLAIGITSSVVAHFLPGVLSLLGLVAGAAVGAFVISWFCNMSLRRGAIAAGTYLGIRLVLSLGLMALTSL